MIRQVFAVILVLTLTQCTLSAQDIVWQTDIDVAKTIAAKQGKLVLLHFSADWCRPCKQLETFVFSSPKVVTAIAERVVPVNVDTDLNPELVKQYDVNQIPTDIVITPTGRLIQKRQSPKDSSNYIRMLQAIDTADIEQTDKNVAIAQKISKVVQAANVESGNPVDNNDFTPNAPENKEIALSRDGQQLQLKSKSQARLVEHTTGENTHGQFQRTSSAATIRQTASGPERVINDRFFSEKSNAVDTKNVKSSSSQSAASAAVKDNAVPREKMGMRDEQAFEPANAKNEMKKQPTLSQTDPSHPSKFAPAKINVAAAQAKLVTATHDKNLVGWQGATAKILPSTNGVAGSDINLPSSAMTQVADRPAATSLQSSIPQNLVDSKTVAQVPVELPAQTLAGKMGLGGKCPVTLMDIGKWVAGDRRFGCMHRGKTYLFAGQEKLTRFQSDPESFSPVLAGFDPVVFHEKGNLVNGKEQHGVFMGKAPNQRIVLFSSAESRAQFQKNPRQYMATVRLAIKQSDTLK